MNRIFATLLLLLALRPALAAPEHELLEPDQAFALSTRVVDAQTLEASWKIAPGYYMYRDKMRFEILEGAVTLREAQIPAGKKKTDPTFGTVETYEKGVTIRLPLERRDARAQNIRLKIGGQGCNEPVGVCYAPITKQVSFALPALIAAAAAEAPSASGLRSLRDLARAVDSTGESPEPMDPEKAFVVSVTPAGVDAFRVRFDINDCCYLYREKIRFELVPAAGAKLPDDARLGTWRLPAGKTKTDEYLGKTEVYTKPFDVIVPVTGLGTGGAAGTLKVHYQGCAEKGVAICYPPTSKTFALPATALAPPAGEAGMPPSSGTPNGKFLAYVAAAFGVGLLLTFTPCVLPMIPILSSVIVGSTGDRRLTKLEGGLLSGAYVLGTAVTYTVAGVVAGATGEQLQAYFQDPIALAVFAVILVALALSMFGFYELQMPSFIQSHLHMHSHKVHSRVKHIKGGAFFGLFGMGLVSALVVGACVSPLLISALGVAIANRDPLLGGATMFAMALGMGVVLIAIGVGAGFLLPRAGAWMERVKHVFGVMLIGVAIYLLGLLPQVPVLLLWGVLFIVTGVYLGATQSVPAGTSGWRYLWKGIGTVLLIWGVVALLGGFAGNRDIMNPLPVQFGAGGVTLGAAPPKSGEALFERVTSLRELESRLAQAKGAGQPVLIDFYADWCTDCLRMEKTTFNEARVNREMTSRFVRLQIDVTDPTNAEVKAMKGRFGVFGPPAMLFFAADGQERRELRTYGFRAPDDFLALLRTVRE